MLDAGRACTASVRAIGGFLPLRLPTPATDSVLKHWLAGSESAWYLHNARSALHALWEALRPARIWLPAYVCQEVAAAGPRSCASAFYPLDAGLHPDVRWLAENLSASDHVLAVDYFGRPPSDAFIGLVRARPDVTWIEDRAHALDTGTQPWGDWVLYSPRKLLGVPDGGILVGRKQSLPRLAPSALWEVDFVMPLIERLEDIGECRNAHWYARYVQQEQAMPMSTRPMSQITFGLLNYLNPQPDADVRRRNFSILARRLARWAFLDETDPMFAPLGFPIRVPCAASLAKHLASRRVFAARHWRTLPSDGSTFEREHTIARELLTLPCDYRYADSDMEAVATAVIDGLTRA